LRPLIGNTSQSLLVPMPGSRFLHADGLIAGNSGAARPLIAAGHAASIPGWMFAPRHIATMSATRTWVPVRSCAGVTVARGSNGESCTKEIVQHMPASAVLTAIKAEDYLGRASRFRSRYPWRPWCGSEPLFLSLAGIYGTVAGGRHALGQ